MVNSPSSGREAGDSPVPALPAEWLLWQLVDSAFPTGGFAHSAGLEAAWQHGELRGGRDVESFTEASLQQAGRGALPFVSTAFDDPGQWIWLDEFCDAFTSNHVANRSSRVQGRAFLASSQRIFGDSLAALPGFNPPYSHLAPAFGVILQCLRVERAAAGRLYIYLQLRGVIAAAVRLGVVGPLEGQAIQLRLRPSAERVFRQCSRLTALEAAQTSPLQEIWQGAQDRLYSRLFQS